MGDAQRAALRDWVAMLRRRWDEANPQARGLAPALPREASADAGGRDQEADPDGNLIFPFWRAVCELEAAVLDVSPKPELLCSADLVDIHALRRLHRHPRSQTRRRPPT